MEKRLLKYIEAKRKTTSLRRFYLHLIIFIIGALGIASLIFWINEGQLKSFWIWLILTTIIIWFVVIAIHAWSVFGDRILFSQNWENRKIADYMDREDLNK